MFVPKNAISYEVKIQKPCQLRWLTPCPRLKKRPVHELSSTECIFARSSDTDVLFLVLKFAKNMSHVVLFDNGTGNKRRLLKFYVKQSIEVHICVICVQL